RAARRGLPAGTSVVRLPRLACPRQVQLARPPGADGGGRPARPADDFHPTYVSGDTNPNGKLDPGETWLYTSSPHTYQVQPGLFGNTTTVTATDPNGQTVTTSYTNWHYGTTPSLFVLKAINAADSMHPTTAELAQTAPGRLLP